METRQPTIRRENTSMADATYTKPRQVATYVRSDPRILFGRAASRAHRTLRSAAIRLASGRAFASAQPNTGMSEATVARRIDRRINECDMSDRDRSVPLEVIP